MPHKKIMLPVIAIIGRVNVGKSTLFNYLTHSQHAIVADQEGLTRDRQYGYGRYDHQLFITIDTGGLFDEQNEMESSITEQCEKAILEADAILFLVDAQSGVMPTDELIIQKLRISKKPILLVANKIDGVDPNIALAEFHRLGTGEPIPISASHSRGINALLKRIFDSLPEIESTDLELQEQEGIKLAIVGKPNVGKSTLVNRMLGEERMIVSDIPGTTRDSIFIPLERKDKHYTLIDTAGIRRKGRVNEKIEKFSVIKTLQAIEVCNVVIFIIDGQEGISEQDLKLLGLVLDSGKALVIAINKWDGLSEDQQDWAKKELERRLNFINFAKWHFISALRGFGVNQLFKSVEQAYDSATKKLQTPKLTRTLQQLIEQHQPPLVRGRRIKLRYAHTGGHNPPIIVIHGKQLQSLPDSYKRYLENGFRKALDLFGTPIKIELKVDENPYG